MYLLFYVFVVIITRGYNDCIDNINNTKCCGLLFGAQ